MRITFSIRGERRRNGRAARRGGDAAAAVRDPSPLGLLTIQAA